VAKGKSRKDLANQLVAFLQTQPELARELGNAMRRVAEGGLRTETLRNLLAYTAYRMKMDEPT